MVMKMQDPGVFQEEIWILFPCPSHIAWSFSAVATGCCCNCFQKAEHPPFIIVDLGQPSIFPLAFSSEHYRLLLYEISHLPITQAVPSS